MFSCPFFSLPLFSFCLLSITAASSHIPISSRATLAICRKKKRETRTTGPTAAAEAAAEIQSAFISTLMTRLSMPGSVIMLVCCLSLSSLPSFRSYAHFPAGITYGITSRSKHSAQETTTRATKSSPDVMLFSFFCEFTLFHSLRIEAHVSKSHHNAKGGKTRN